MNASLSVPTPVFVAQWVLLGGLGFLVILMYRQLAYLIRVGKSVSSDGGLAIGQPAPAFEYWPARNSGGRAQMFQPRGTASILLFADPACPSCERAVSVLADVIRGEDEPVRVVVVTEAWEELIDAFEVFRTTHLELVRASEDVAARLYETSVTPCFFGIDDDGVIRAKAVTDKERDIRQLIRDIRPGVRRTSEDALRTDAVGISTEGGRSG